MITPKAASDTVFSHRAFPRLTEVNNLIGRKLDENPRLDGERRMTVSNGKERNHDQLSGAEVEFMEGKGPREPRSQAELDFQILCKM
jgi:hypothetical protein